MRLSTNFGRLIPTTAYQPQVDFRLKKGNRNLIITSTQKHIPTLGPHLLLQDYKVLSQKHTKCKRTRNFDLSVTFIQLGAIPLPVISEAIM